MGILMPATPAKFFEGASYVGRSAANRATYYAYETVGDYLLVSKGRDASSYYLFRVPAEVVGRVQERFGGETVSAKDVTARVRSPYWHRYGALLVLAAQKRARLVNPGKKPLRFRIRKA